MTKPTTEARRHGERSGNREVGKSGDRENGRRSDNFYEVKISHAACVCHPERVGANATASRRTPAVSVPEQPASGSSHEAANLTAETLRRGEETSEHLTTEARRHGERSGNREIGKSGDRKALALEMMNRVAQTIRATLREIFDESAYDRFLLRTHASRSIASYREFTRERDAAMLKKPRCC
jgi:hypothetical protein